MGFLIFVSPAEKDRIMTRSNRIMTRGLATPSSIATATAEPLTVANDDENVSFREEQAVGFGVSTTAAAVFPTAAVAAANDGDNKVQANNPNENVNKKCCTWNSHDTATFVLAAVIGIASITSGVLANRKEPPITPPPTHSSSNKWLFGDSTKGFVQ